MTGWPTGSRSTPRRRRTPTSIRSRRSRSTSTTTARTTSTDLTTYRFTQNIGYNADGKLVAPVAYPSLYAGDEDGKVTAPAAMWGVPRRPGRADHHDPLLRRAEDLWVDPVSGTIVKEAEHANHYFARDPLKPELTLVDYKVTSNEETVESQVNAARDERDRLALWSRVLPITFTAVGLIAIIGGALLASFSLRTESALTDPGLDRGDQDFFGRSGPTGPCPGPKPRPRSCPPSARSAAASPRADAPTTASDEPAEAESPAPDKPSGPPERDYGSDALAVRWTRPGYALVLALLVTAPLLGARVSAVARRGVDAALVPVRWGSGIDVGAAGDAAGFRGGAGLAGARRWRRGEGAAGRGVVAGGMGRGPAGRGGAAVGGCGGPVRRDDAGDLESLRRRAAAAGALEPAGRLRLPAVGCHRDAQRCARPAPGAGCSRWSSGSRWPA